MNQNKMSNKYLFNQIVDCRNCKWHCTNKTEILVNQCTHLEARYQTRYYYGDGAIHLSLPIEVMRTNSFLCGSLGKFYESK